MSASPPDPVSQGRTKLPGIFLLVSAGINLVAGLIFVGIGVHGHTVAIAEFRHRLETEYPAQHQEISRSGWPVDRWIWNTSTGLLVLGLGGVVTGSLAIAGVRKLWRTGSTRLTMVASLLIAVPGISPSGCLAIGSLAGLWMVLILSDPE